MHGRAASDSEDAVPLSWVSLLNDGAAVLVAARKLVDLRETIQGVAPILHADTSMDV